MKNIILCILLFLLSSTTAGADRIFDEIRSAIKQNVAEDKLIALVDKYKGSIISGQAFVDRVAAGIVTKGVIVHASEQVSETALSSDIKITVSESSPFLNTVKGFNKGQDFTFIGKFIDISKGTILVKGSVSLKSH